MTWFAIGAINMAVVVAMGAFAAHGLKARLTPESLAWWQTAVQYHALHALGLLLIGLLAKHSPQTAVNGPALSLQLGIVFFCGSLFAMSLGAPRWFGAITPIGGTLFIVGWLWLAREVTA